MRSIAVLGLVTAMAACSSGGGSSASASDPPRAGLPPAPEGDQISVKITNNARSEVTLTADVQGRRVRLGTLQPNRTDIYFVDVRGNEEVRIEIRMLGGGRCTTSPRSVSPGEQIIAVVPAELSMMPDCR